MPPPGSPHQHPAAIHVSQPAATHLLRQLEEGLGVRLFERHARGVTPTAFGETMVRYARDTLHSFDHAHEEMAALAAGASGRVKIGAVMGSVPSLLTAALMRCKRDSPRLHVSVQVNTSDLLLPALLRGDLDVVLGRLPDQLVDDRLHVRMFDDEQMCIVVRPGHRMARKRSLALRHLLDCTWVLHPIGSPMRNRIDQALVAAGLARALDVLETTSILATTTLLESTDMVSVLPTTVAQHYVRYRMLKVLPVALPLSLAPLGIITRAGRSASPALQTVVRLFEDEATKRR